MCHCNLLDGGANVRRLTYVTADNSRMSALIFDPLAHELGGL